QTTAVALRQDDAAYPAPVYGAETEEDYVRLYNAIEAHGRFEYYNRRHKRYLYPGDGRKYWHMGPLYQSRIINRMKIKDDLPRLQREGQINRPPGGAPSPRSSFTPAYCSRAFWGMSFSASALLNSKSFLRLR